MTEEQEQILTDVITEKQNLFIHSIESEVMTKDEANRLKAESEIISVAKIVRSGQVLETEGDLLLIGDVNPGGMVKAGGNIFILGSLRGIAHAGFNGNKRACYCGFGYETDSIAYQSCAQSLPRQHPRRERHGMCLFR